MNASAVAKALRELADAIEQPADEDRPAFVAPAEILDCAGAGALLGWHSKSVERKARTGEIPAFKVGREWRFRRADLLEWLAQHKDQVA